MRTIRQTTRGVLYHVISRFIDREFLVNDDDSRGHYIALLGRAMTASDWRCRAFAVMSNHIHLAMLAGRSAPESWLRRIHPPFAAWLNKRLGRIGPLVAGDPEIWEVHRDREHRLIAYIHNNPVRAGVVAHARDSSWTSHQLYMGAKRCEWFDARQGLSWIGVTASELDAFVDGETRYTPERAALDGLRRAARRRGALEIGTATEDKLPSAALVARPFARILPDPLRVVGVAVEVLGLPSAQLRSRDRRPDSGRGRTVVVHAARALGLTISSAAVALGISPQRGSQLASRRLGSLERAAMELIVSRVESELGEAIAGALVRSAT
jgi:hypothetical protein